MIWVGLGLAAFGTSALALVAWCMVDEVDEWKEEARQWEKSATGTFSWNRTA